LIPINLAAALAIDVADLGIAVVCQEVVREMMPPRAFQVGFSERHLLCGVYDIQA